MEYVNFQLSAFFILLFTGMVLGGFFDLYRVFRSQIRVNKTIDFIGDLFFWLLAAVLVIPLIYWSTWLEIRLYVWLAIAGGLILYFRLFSFLAIPLFKRFWRGLSWLPRTVLNRLWHFWIFGQKVVRFFIKSK